MYPAFALYRLGDDPRRINTDGLFQCAAVIGAYELCSLKQRFERLAILCLTGYRQSCRRSAVERIVQCNDPVLPRCARFSCGPRNLERYFHGLGAAIGKEDTRQAAPFGETLCKGPLIGMIEEVRRVKAQPRLFLNCAKHPWVGVSERVDTNSRNEVEITAPL